MNDKIDYKKLGLKCGLEIHQQLDTHKLFCNCPSEIVSNENNEVGNRIIRKLIATRGEKGKIDIAAKREQEKNKEIVYISNQKNSCLVDLDEEPPHKINEEAVKIATQVAKMLNMKLIDEVQVMRKIVVDGSNTTGFQRTCLIGINGFVEINGKKIKIETLCLEEDSARKIEEKTINTKDGKKQVVVYNLDRLGIPLIEITTAPDMEDPEETKKVAEEIGLILRSVKVKRGLGTIRQDVNVSIKEGVRTEIKGVQNLKDIPLIIENEVKRQLSLIDVKKKLEKLNKENKKIEFGKIQELTEIFQNTNSKIIKKSLEKKGNGVYGIKIKNFKGFLGMKTMPGRRVGSEVSDYIKSMIKIGGIFHKDELPNYGISEEEVKKIEKKLECEKNDNFILVVSSKNEAKKIFEIAKQRIELLSKEIPKETRNATKDGTSRYMRPMSSGARMYPETDIIPFILPKDVEIPKTINEKIKEYEKLGLGKTEAKTIAKDYSAIFDYLIDKFKKTKPTFIADLLLSKKQELKKKGFSEELIESKIDSEIFEIILSHLEEGKITKKAIENILVDHLKGNLKIENYFLISEEETKEEIERLIKELEKNGVEKKKIKGIIIGRLSKKADPKTIIKILKEKGL